jgi:hypothetical protein
MADFDRFTMDVAGGDPVTRAALEAGTINRYWDAAVAYVNKLLSAHQAAKAAEKRADKVPSRAWHRKR